MNNQHALEIINALASGIDPVSGEIFPPQSALQHPEIIRALYVASIALRDHPAKTRNPNLPHKAGMPWTEVEDQELLAAFDQGRAEKELAELHQRSRGAIRSRLMLLGRIEGPKPPVETLAV